MSDGDPLREIYLCSDHDSVPAGVRLGAVVIAPAISAADPCTGEFPEGLEPQIRGTFENMSAFLEAAGVGREHVARVTFFMSDLSERLLLNPPWMELYPDPHDRPPHKYVPAKLPEGLLVRAQVIALAGARRRVLEVPGVAHMDPMSMGALTGNLVTSSRVVTGQRGDDVNEQTSTVFANVGALIRDAGGDFGNLTQITAFIGEPRFRANVEAELRRVMGDGVLPVLHVLETDLGGNGFPRIEIIGLV